MRLLRNILALAPCGKPQAAHFAHVTDLLQWLPGRVHFTGLKHYGGRSARTHARWFARPFPFVCLAVTTLEAVHPREQWELLALDWMPTSCQERSRNLGCRLVLERHGPRRLLGPRVTLLAAVDGGYASRTFVEGVRELGLHTVGRLRRDAVLRFPYTGPHERRPGRKRQFDGFFDRRDPARMTRTTLKGAKVDRYHAVRQSKAWQCRLAGGLTSCPSVPTRRRRREYSSTAPTWTCHRNASSTSMVPDSKSSLPSAMPSSTWASTIARPVRRPGSTFISTWSSLPSSGPACRPSYGRGGPSSPFPCATPVLQLRRRNTQNDLPPRRARVETPPIPKAAAAAPRRNACGCVTPLPKRARPVPEHRPQPAQLYDSGIKMCPNHRRVTTGYWNST